MTTRLLTGRTWQKLGARVRRLLPMNSSSSAALSAYLNMCMICASVHEYVMSGYDHDRTYHGGDGDGYVC
jgi:hypothetical protein